MARPRLGTNAAHAARTQPGALRDGWRAEIDDYVAALAWAPDGRLLAAAAAGGPIYLFDGATGRLARGLAGHDGGTLALSWSPDGATLASAGQDGVARLWTVTPADSAERALPGGAAWVERVAWSPSGSLVATGAGKILRVWDADGTLAYEYGGHQSTVADLAWRPGGGALATAAYGGVTLWDPDAADTVRRFTWVGASLALAWSPHGRYIATGDQDASVHFWIVATGGDLMMRGYQAKVRQLAWDHTSRYLATGGNAAVLVWDCAGRGPEGTRPLVLEAHERSLSALAFQRRGPLLASGDPDGRVALWNPSQGRKIRGRATRAASIAHLVWSPDDRLLAVGDADGGVAVLAAP